MRKKAEHDVSLWLAETVSAMRQTLLQLVLSVALISVGGCVTHAAVPATPTSGVQTTTLVSPAITPENKPAWLTPEKEAALVEVRMILKEARQVAEEIDAPNTPQEKMRPGVPLSYDEEHKQKLLHAIEYIQFRAGDFSSGATTTVRASLAFAQLQYGQVQDALRILRDERLRGNRLGAVSAMTLVQTLAQAGYMDAAIEMADAHSKYERRSEGRLFALIAKEQAKLGDARARDTLQQARMTAKFAGTPNDRALSLVHVARVQRSLGDQAGSEESLRWALDIARNAPRDRSTMVLRTIAMALADHGDQTGSAKLFKQILEEEKSLNLSERVQRLASQACELAVRGYPSSATEMFQDAMQIADGLPIGEQIRMWREIGQRLVKSGDQAAVWALVQRIVETAQSIEDERTRKDALAGASFLAAMMGDLERAIQLATMTNDEWRAVSLFRFIAEQAIETNHPADTDATLRQLSKAVEESPGSQLPKDRSQSDGRLADIAKIQAAAGDVSLAVRTLKRISGQDWHQGSGAYPQIVTLLARQRNFAGARQIVDAIEKKSLKGISVAESLQRLGSAHAEAGDTQTALDWARHMKVGFAKASILLGVAEGLMNRQGIEKIEDRKRCQEPLFELTAVN